MPTKTIDDTTYELVIDRILDAYEINWTNGSDHCGFARFPNELEAAAVWAALTELA